MMYRRFKIVKVDYKYCDYLRKFDKRVIYNAGIKSLRPFIGILFKIDNIEYFAPLSSPKPKHKKLKNAIDLIKIDDGNYGVINFNNMIPVYSFNYEEFDFNMDGKSEKEKARIRLLINQLRWLNSNRKEIYSKSILLYHLYKSNNLDKSVRDRCCNFPLLEEKCKEYNLKA